MRVCHAPRWVVAFVVAHVFGLRGAPCCGPEQFGAVPPDPNPSGLTSASTVHTPRLTHYAGRSNSIEFGQVRLKLARLRPALAYFRSKSTEKCKGFAPISPQASHVRGPSTHPYASEGGIVRVLVCTIRLSPLVRGVLVATQAAVLLQPGWLRDAKRYADARRKRSRKNG